MPRVLTEREQLMIPPDEDDQEEDNGWTCPRCLAQVRRDSRGRICPKCGWYEG